MCNKVYTCVCKGERADFLLQKYRSTEKYRKVQRSSKKNSVPSFEFYSKTEQKCSEIGNSQKLRKLLFPYTEYFCYVLRTEVPRSTEVRPFPLAPIPSVGKCLRKLLLE